MSVIGEDRGLLVRPADTPDPRAGRRSRRCRDRRLACHALARPSPDRPIGLLLCGIVHYVMDEEKPAEIVAALAGVLPRGSYVFIHHLLDTGDPAATGLQGQLLNGLGKARFRTLAEARALFGGLEFVPPGLVTVPEWRPEPGTPEDHSLVLRMACAGVSRIP